MPYPEIVPGLQIVEVLSESARGGVYRARRDAEPREVVLHVGPKGVAAQASLFARLADPGLIAPTTWGLTADGRPYLVRRYVEGQPFDRAARGAPAAEVVRWVCSLLRTLACLHQAGLVHRDVKSDNVVVGPEGVFLVDLDLLAGTGSAAPAAGTAVHMAPEVLLGRPPEPASDLFSLGVMLALASCGAPRAEFHLDFPRRSFWIASGLDPKRLDPELASLVLALVRRHPHDRPASATAAARLLAGMPADLPEPTLPFLAGRETAAVALCGRLADREGPAVTLVTVEDEEDEPLLLDEVELSLVLSGCRAARASAELLGARSDLEITGLVENGTEVLLARASDLDPAHEPVDLVLPILVPTASVVPRLALLLSPEAARELGAALRRRGLEELVSSVETVAWPRVPRGAIERQLLQLTDHSAPEAARRAAQSLHRCTAGRWSDTDRLLRSAVRDGVLKPAGGSYVLQLTEWLSPVVEASFAARVASLGADERAALLALACLDEPSDEGLLAEVSGLPTERCASALARLVALGVVERSLPRQARDRRWLAAALHAEDRDALRHAHRRCEKALARRGAASAALARHRLGAAATPADFLAVLQAAWRELERGRLAAARALIQGVQAGEPALRPRSIALQARLELAQGRAADALALLTGEHGEGFERAPTDALLVAAHAHEQLGRGDAARRLLERALAAATDRTESLRALTGLGYRLFLSGAWEAVLDTTRGEPRDDDPDEPAAALLNLRGVALTRLRRHDEAQAALDAARRRAQAAGDPLSLARTELDLAYLDRRRGALAAAAAGLQRALSAFGEAGHVQGRALALNNLGVLQRDLGDLSRARALLGESLVLRRRVGDVHGAASSRGSLALVALDAGHVGTALAALGRAREHFANAEQESELALLDQTMAMALALAGRQPQARALLEKRRAGTSRRELAALSARAEALVQLLGDQQDAALAAARRALRAAADSGELAESFRAAGLVVVLAPGDTEATGALRDAAERLDSPVRRAEAELRLLSPHERPTRETLERWSTLFEQTGRTDHLARVSTLLADVLDRAGDSNGRRRALARAADAADALTDGLPPHDREPTLERLARLGGAAPAAQPTRRLTVEWFLACNRRLAAEEDLDDLLNAIMDMALDLTGARRGFLVLLDGEAVTIRVARGLDESTLEPDELRFSRTVVREAVSSHAPVVTTDAARDGRFSSSESISSLQLRSVVCVPLPGPQAASGALYLDNDQREAAFDATDVERLSSLADQAAVAITNLRRRQQIETLNGRLAERLELQKDELIRARTLLRRRGTVAPIGGLVGASEGMVQVYSLIERLAPTDLPVLITGPSGSGKDLVARALHARSRRANGPLVIENVSALPANLLESELFGHLRGAFTGADRDRNGLFAEAQGGSFFLDEVGEMPIELQAKLLRVLESGEMRPVGSRKTVRVDVRIIAATNRQLPVRVREKAFREDLYYRLNAAEIRMPSLAERIEDIPLLVRHFLERLNAKHGLAKDVTDDVLAALVRRPWPGQVRELANEVARVYFLSDDRLDQPRLVRAPAADDLGDEQPASLQLEVAERAALVRALGAAGGRKEKAARLLGISRAGLYAKLKRLGLTAEG